MKELRIGELAARAGIRASAIRYYESVGLLAPADRRGGRRVYPPEVLDSLAFIRLAQLGGFRISEIRTLLRGFPPGTPPGVRWRALAEGKLRELDERRARLEAMQRILGRLSRCECPSLESCGRALRQAAAGGA